MGMPIDNDDAKETEKSCNEIRQDNCSKYTDRADDFQNNVDRCMQPNVSVMCSAIVDKTEQEKK